MEIGNWKNFRSGIETQKKKRNIKSKKAKKQKSIEHFQIKNSTFSSKATKREDREKRVSESMCVKERKEG